MSKARPKILLDPVDFMALHFSALAFGGIGHTNLELGGAPHCKWGHADFLQPYRETDDGVSMNERLVLAGLDVCANDRTLRNAGIESDEKVDFEQYIKLLNIDIKE